MSVYRVDKTVLRVDTPIRRRLTSAAATFLITGVSLTACAAEPVYNPAGLQTPEFTRVTDICQRVMGLSPKEPMVGGYWSGEPDLDYYTNKYRVCITSLSSSLRNLVDTKVTQSADAECRAKGYPSGSSDLALCVLNTSNQRPDPLATAAASQPPNVTGKLPATVSGSYYYASPRSNARRERVACAALGIEPTEPEFRGCVSRIDHALNALDNPII
jgi:hypothetical protein